MVRLTCASLLELGIRGDPSSKVGHDETALSGEHVSTPMYQKIIA